MVMYIDMMGRGGAQRVMANLADFFAGKGLEIILVNDFKLGDEVAQYPVSEKVKRIYLKDTNTGNAVVKNVQRVVTLRKVIQKENPDLILSFLGRPNLRMLLATLGLKNKKVVSVRNDPNREYGTGFFKRNVARFLFLFADGCVFQTREAREYFFQPTKKKSEVIMNPVGEAFFNVQQESSPRNVIAVGRFEPQKNHMLLMRAFGALADKFPEEKLVIYGAGRLEQEYFALRRKLGLENRILFPGNVNNVPRVLAKAKIFVLSSDYEGMPNALMEAMAAGLPCISTDCPCGGPKDLITNGRDGILVATADLEGLCNALEGLLRDAEERKQIGAAAKQRAEVFRQERILARWEHYFEQVTGTTNV